MKSTETKYCWVLFRDGRFLGRHDWHPDVFYSHRLSPELASRALSIWPDALALRCEITQQPGRAEVIRVCAESIAA